MIAAKRGLIVVCLVALSACAGTEPPSRSAAIGQTLAARGVPEAAPAAVRLAARYRVAAVRVEVPETLRVSEANVFYPIADIVWRGEAPGDRRAQVGAIVAEGLNAGVSSMRGDDPALPAVTVTATMTRFHTLTEKARYTVGGVHALHFVLTLRAAATGALVEPPRAIVADVRAAGGSAAMAEDRAGRTQRVVITERLAAVIRRELSSPVATARPVSDLAARSVSTLRLTPAPFAP